MTQTILGILAAAFAALAALAALIAARRAAAAATFARRLEESEQRLGELLTAQSKEDIERIERAKGEINQHTAARFSENFGELRRGMDEALAAGRKEQAESLERASKAQEERLARMAQAQAQSLAESRQELAKSLGHHTAQLESRFEALSKNTGESLEKIREKVDQQLRQINQEVQKKLNENLKEGFSQFEKVQQHLKAAEQQLHKVGELGESVHDLNRLLKLPHLRGRFGELSLERLLGDFLPGHLYELQGGIGEGGRLRPDAVIHLPERDLPIDSKFPREQVLALFETEDPQKLTEARRSLERVVKEQASDIVKYIRPEEGSTEMALMFLPSETLWFEVVRNPNLVAALNEKQVFPVSPNTLLMVLTTISHAHRWYQIAAGFEETRKELGLAQKHFGNFEKQFDSLGKNLERAQKSYHTATRHLSNYQNKVFQLTGVETPELQGPPAPEESDED